MTVEDYPDVHPKANEIKSMREELNVLYDSLKRHEEDSRQHYRFAMDNLKAMGEDNRSIHETLKNIAEKLETFKTLAESPLL